MEPISSVILCGGKSRRMGRDKARLPWNGETFLDEIAASLSRLGEVFLSADDKERFMDMPYPVIKDRYSDCGPLNGVCSALAACGTPLLFVVCCDMPFVSAEVGEALGSRMERGTGAVVPRETLSGRPHPLCAVYRREAAAPLLRRLRAGNLRMRDAVEALRPRYVPAETLPGGSRVLRNVNTPEDYRALLAEGGHQEGNGDGC